MKKAIKWPKVTFLLLTYNGGEGVKKCLESIKQQDYPQELIDIVVVDDASIDNSIAIARRYTDRIFISGKKDMYLSWAIGLHKAKGDFIYLVEQDIELRHKNFIKMMILPLIENPQFAASFTRSYPKKEQHWVTRFISYHPAQCDPLYEYLTPPVEDTFVEEKTGFTLCHFKLGSIPPDARMFFRMDYIKKTPIWKMKRCFDHDLVVKMVKKGYNQFAYVPSAGIYHSHATSLKHLLSKRVRNLTSHYFPYQNSLEYRWLDVTSKKDIIRMMMWVIYANLFIPATIRGIIRAIKHRDMVLLAEPIITITTTDVILIAFLRNGVGRKIITQSLRTLFSNNKKLLKGAFGA